MTLSTLREELARCDREIERIKVVLREGREPGPGAGILGLHDWFYEKQLILKEIRMAEWPAVSSVKETGFTQVHFETGRDLSDIHEAALLTDLENYEPVLERLQDINVLRLLHAAMGLATESGELLDMLKKHLFYGKPVDWTNAKEELGDVSWYWRLGLDASDSNMVENLLTNIQKLKKRYAGKFSESAALNRNLPAERAVLEGNNEPAR